MPSSGLFSWSLAGRLAAYVILLQFLVAGSVVGLMAAGVPSGLAFLFGALLGVIGTVIVVPVVLQPARRALAALENGVDGLRSHDYGLRLALDDERDELGLLARVFNDLADQLSRERSDLRQREILLHTVIETSPAAVLLINAFDRILLDNRSSRRLLGGGSRLSGRSFTELIQQTPEPLQRALESAHDALVTLEASDGLTESFQVTSRIFDVNARRHRLVMVRRLTAELRRQETAAWKKVTRVIAHELNNTLAPVRSMVHSARVIRAKDPADARLEEILGHIDDSAASLQRFVDGYRSLARLPEPRLERVGLTEFLNGLASAEPFRLVGRCPTEPVVFDAGQLRLALVNLLKNAREAGSPADEIEIEIVNGRDSGLQIVVRDRGPGLSDEALARALVPFYSTKKGGTGLGLALAREIVEGHGGHLSISSREGGGVEVRCDLPRREPRSE